MTVTGYDLVIDYDTAAVARGRREQIVPCAIQPRDLELIDVVMRCRFLTTPHLLELWWPGAAPQVGRRRLTKLFEAGYLDRFRPVARRGSFPWTYQLGREGHRLLQRAGRVPWTERFDAREVYDYRYVLHDVHLYSWVLAWRRLLGEQLVRWDGETQIGTREELRRLRRAHQAEVAVDGLRDPAPKPVRPDALVEAARRGGEGTHTFLVEYDRTRRVDKNFEKFRRYDTFACWWWRYTEYGEADRAPWVVFVCQNEDQRDRFLVQADQEVTGRLWEVGEGSGEQEFAGRHRMLFVSEGDVYEGRAVAHRLPALPPGHPAREGSALDARVVRLPGTGVAGEGDEEMQRRAA